jgi:hypothetical protein
MFFCSCFLKRVGTLLDYAAIVNPFTDKTVKLMGAGNISIAISHMTRLGFLEDTYIPHFSLNENKTMR